MTTGMESRIPFRGFSFSTSSGRTQPEGRSVVRAQRLSLSAFKRPALTFGVDIAANFRSAATLRSSLGCYRHAGRSKTIRYVVRRYFKVLVCSARPSREGPDCGAPFARSSAPPSTPAFAAMSAGHARSFDQHGFLLTGSPALGPSERTAFSARVLRPECRFQTLSSPESAPVQSESSPFCLGSSTIA